MEVGARDPMPDPRGTPFPALLPSPLCAPPLWGSPLCGLLLGSLLLGSLPLSLGEETEGVPFFNDADQLTLPGESVAELEEAMPETRLFRRRSPAIRAPELSELTPGS